MRIFWLSVIFKFKFFISNPLFHLKSLFLYFKTLNPFYVTLVSIVNENNEWLRDDSKFICVADTCLFRAPVFNNSMACSALVTFSSLSPSMYTPFF